MSQLCAHQKKKYLRSQNYLRLRLNKLLRTFGALQTSRVLHIPMKAQLTHGTTVRSIRINKTSFQIGLFNPLTGHFYGLPWIIHTLEYFGTQDSIFQTLEFMLELIRRSSRSFSILPQANLRAKDWFVQIPAQFFR